MQNPLEARAWKAEDIPVRLSTLLSSLTVAASMLTAGSALAAKRGGDDGDYPLAYALRPMTLPRLTLAPELDLEVGRALNSVGTASSRYTLAGLNVGAAFGITDNIEVGAFVLPIQFAPSVSYGSGGDPAANLQLFGTFRFLHAKQVEIGARLRTYFITTSGAGAQIVPSVPFLFHLGKIARIDAEIALPITARGSSAAPGSVNPGGAVVGVAVPVSFAINVIEPLYLGASSGVRVEDFGNAKRSFFIPLGFFAGFTIGGRRPIVDLAAYFQWNHFAQPSGGALGNGDKIVAGDFHTGLAVKGYIFF